MLPSPKGEKQFFDILIDIQNQVEEIWMSSGAHFSANFFSFDGVSELYEGVRCGYMELDIRRLFPKAIGSVGKGKERKGKERKGKYRKGAGLHFEK
jgi:hypothetical protein